MWNYVLPPYYIGYPEDDGNKSPFRYHFLEVNTNTRVTAGMDKSGTLSREIVLETPDSVADDMAGRSLRIESYR